MIDANSVVLADSNILCVPATPKHQAKCTKKPNKAKSRVTLEVAIMKPTKAPNLSRKNQGSVLCPFPTFDRCDSLLFFPYTFTALMNSGDFKGMLKLLTSRLSRKCVITMAVTSHKLSIPLFIDMFEMMNDLHPDSFFCVHNVKVIGNEVRAAMHFKFTDCKMIYDSMERSGKNKDLLNVCGSARTELSSYLATKSAVERMMFTNVVEADADMIVYGRSELILTFDDVTKKVIGFHIDCAFTSFAAC